MREIVNNKRVAYESPSLDVMEVMPCEVLCGSTSADLENYDVLTEQDW